MNCGNKILWIVLGWMLVQPAQAREALHWKELAAGWHHAKILIEAEARHGALHLFRIDPTQYRLEVLVAKELGLSYARAKTFAEKSKALLVINGGYFTPEFQSLGLIARNGQTINPKHTTGWWSVFHITHHQALLENSRLFQTQPDTEMAIQAGPRLVIDGAPAAKLKPGLAKRSAIGTDTEGKIYLVATENVALTLEDFAKWLTEAGLHNVLNLDGGGSTQLFAAIKGFHLNLTGDTPVANGIAIFPR